MNAEVGMFIMDGATPVDDRPGLERKLSNDVWIGRSFPASRQLGFKRPVQRRCLDVGVAVRVAGNSNPPDPVFGRQA